MLTEEKIQEIRKKLQKGYPQGELFNELLQQGYSSYEIQNALYALSQKQEKISNPINIPLWYAASIGFIILGIAILSVKYLWIYNYGYIFLGLGITGLLAKYLIDEAKKKR